jgi:lipoyl(octanoyl) transferase
VRKLSVLYLGRRRYAPVMKIMERLSDERLRGLVSDVVLLLEHEPVLTGGRTAKKDNILISPLLLQEEGVEYHETNRGGDVTLHAPGQLVAYPVLDLKPDRADVRKYVQSLTRIMAALCQPFGIDAGTFPGKIGLWADADRPEEYRGPELAGRPVKLGAVGVRISRWVTSHGFALNIKTDLSLFRWIVPCGIADFEVASVLSLSGQAPEMKEIAARAAAHFASEFEAQFTFSDLSTATEAELDGQVFDSVRTRE